MGNKKRGVEASSFRTKGLGEKKTENIARHLCRPEGTARRYKKRAMFSVFFSPSPFVLKLDASTPLFLLPISLLLES